MITIKGILILIGAACVLVWGVELLAYILLFIYLTVEKLWKRIKDLLRGKN